MDIIKLNGGNYKVHNLKSAETFCRKIALGHYENFPVGSLLLPKYQRQDIFNIYAFARIADDIADTEQIPSISQKLELLDSYEHLLYQLDSSQLANPVFVALSSTIKKFKLPIEPFVKLIKAFKADSDFKLPQSYSDIEEYCSNSANPVGELVLRVFGKYNSNTAPLSDAICTGLQLVNFWQDLSLDLQAGRCYIPQEALSKYGLNYSEYTEWRNNPNFEKCLKEILDYTEKFFVIGKDLIKLLSPFRLKLEINATLIGGISILNKVIDLNTNILDNRPSIKKSEMLMIMLKSII